MARACFGFAGRFTQKVSYADAVNVPFLNWHSRFLDPNETEFYPASACIFIFFDRRARTLAGSGDEILVISFSWNAWRKTGVLAHSGCFWDPDQPE